MQGINKWLVVEKFPSAMFGGGKPPNFVTCIENDKSDEDMFGAS